MSDLIKTILDNQYFHLILNRSDARNAINLPMIDAIGEALHAAEKAFTDGQARVLLVRAEGRAFSQGIDLHAQSDYIDQFGQDWQDNLFATTRHLQDVLTQLERCSLPSICLIQGYCIGTGFELALACDFRIAAERTRISLPESRLGIIPDVGGTARLVKLIGSSRAKEVILTGRTIDLTQAEQWGMVNYVVPKADLLTKGLQLAEELTLAAPMAVNYGKRVINDIVDIQGGLNIEAWAQAALFRSEDFKHALQAMNDKNATIKWTGR